MSDRTKKYEYNQGHDENTVWGEKLRIQFEYDRKVTTQQLKINEQVNSTYRATC